MAIDFDSLRTEYFKVRNIKPFKQLKIRTAYFHPSGYPLSYILPNVFGLHMYIAKALETSINDIMKKLPRYYSLYEYEKIRVDDIHHPLSVVTQSLHRLYSQKKYRKENF